VKIGWRLAVTLMLFGLGALALNMPLSVQGTVEPASLNALPATLGSWTGTDGIPEEYLPSDPNEKSVVRRTYRNGAQIAWVSVALFAGQNNDARRASVNKIYPQRNVSIIEPLSFTVPLNGPSASPVALPAVALHQQDAPRLVVVYWHQIGRQTFGSEYRFRLALTREILFARRADSILVRIAVPTTDSSGTAQALETVSTLVPLLYTAMNDSITVRVAGKS
jgi:EpsI family protein